MKTNQTMRELLGIDALEAAHGDDISYSVDCEDNTHAARHLRDYVTCNYSGAVQHAEEYAHCGVIGITAWTDGGAIASWTYDRDQPGGWTRNP